MHPRAKNILEKYWYDVLVIVLLILQLVSFYSFYAITLWVVCIVAIYHAYMLRHNTKNTWFWIFVVMAVFFNPIAPIAIYNLTTWRILDLAAALVLAYRLKLIDSEHVKGI